MVSFFIAYIIACIICAFVSKTYNSDSDAVIFSMFGIAGVVLLIWAKVFEY